ncbi:hypothetical protein [Thalassoglobus polymorphus]|uniref:Uncharacterized protein n=1 Tax=Thalassoglobus polymorphus TaxID=2527994 RepID=A0A517QIT1_9PLAN|nr:hypothetical protein [Thalassoglobus polymorphus]QDT31516.1 hypothetical protein Mal48_07500 [Thalassoglobus polymorphus]
MKLVKRIGCAFAVMACVAMLDSAASAGHIVRITAPAVYRDIASNGNLSIGHVGSVDAKINTKRGKVVVKGKRGNIRNSSRGRYNARNLPGTSFGFPPAVGIRVHYKVSADDKDNQHDEDAKIRGKN